MLDALKKYYYKQRFHSGIIGLFVSPFYFAGKGLYENTSALAVNVSGKTVTGNSYLNLLITFFCMAPCNILGELLSWLLPDNNDLYLDNVVLAKKVGDA